MKNRTRVAQLLKDIKVFGILKTEAQYRVECEGTMLKVKFFVNDQQQKAIRALMENEFSKEEIVRKDISEKKITYEILL